MKCFSPSRSFPLPLFLLSVSAGVAYSAVIDVTPGTNNLIISQVTYMINGLDLVQTVEAAGVQNVGDTPVYLKSVRITDGTPVDLNFFNTAGAKVVNINPQLATKSGIGVFDNGTVTASTSGAAFAAALEGTATDTDLRNFSFQDLVTPALPVKSGFDYDLYFRYALDLSDYLLVSERWGNSSFLVTALDVDGNVYAGSNTLRLGGAGLATGQSYDAYDWNTGYAAATNVSSQAQAITVSSVAKFFPSGQTGGPVYGLRVELPGITTGPGGIQGEADTKILGISDETFLDNPENPQVVPEPSAFLMSILSALAFLGWRKRSN